MIEIAIPKTKLAGCIMLFAFPVVVPCLAICLLCVLAGDWLKFALWRIAGIISEDNEVEE